MDIPHVEEPKLISYHMDVVRALGLSRKEPMSFLPLRVIFKVDSKRALVRALAAYINHTFLVESCFSITSTLYF
jgi:hypothetical protein